MTRGWRAVLASLLAAGLVLPLQAASAQDEVLVDGAGLRAFAQAERARPPAPRLPRRQFLSRPVLREAALAPDGRRVVALLDDGRVRRVQLATREAPAGRDLVARTTADAIAVSRDGRWVFLVEPTRVLAAAIDASGAVRGVAAVGGTTHRAFAGVDPWRSAAVLLLETPPVNAPAPRRFRLWRAEPGGKLELLHESRLEIVDFAFAPNGRLSHLLLASHDSHVVLHRSPGDAWRALAVCRKMRRCSFISTADQGRTLVMRTNLGSDRAQLQRIGADGRRTLLHGDPRGEADLDEVVLDPSDNTPLIVAYRSTVAHNHGLVAPADKQVAALGRRFAGRNLRIEVGRERGADWLVHERGGSMRSERLTLVDPAAPADGVAVFAGLAAQRDGHPEALPTDASMARQRAVRWTGSDGALLHGFLLLPPGVDAARAPLVVVVHGGPFNQVRPEFNGSAQFLANRGYAVFLPNFRSSTGLGRDYVFGGAGDFGGEGRVQRDTVEGTRWLLDHGIGDPARVGIVGASFGGYASLLGVTFQPELFKVGVAAVPPSDFGFVMREYLGANKPMMAGVRIAASMRDLGMDPADAALRERLRIGSPQANAARMARPLLLLAGGEDDRVPIRGVTHYAATLKGLGKDVSLFIDTDAGHGLADPRTREAYLYLEETLLHRTLGGVAPEPPSVDLQAHLKRNLRLLGPSLR